MKSKDKKPKVAERSKRERLGSEAAVKNVVGSWVVPALIILLTSTAFFPVLQNEFLNWDDGKALLENPYYRGLGWGQIKWMFTTFHMGHYQPLSWFTFALDYLVWELNSFGYHLTNLVLHSANAVLFYFIALVLFNYSLSGSFGKVSIRVAAAIAALIFSLHPLRVEAVAWATERRDVLASFFPLDHSLLPAGQQNSTS